MQKGYVITSKDAKLVFKKDDVYMKLHSYTAASLYTRGFVEVCEDGYTRLTAKGRSLDIPQNILRQLDNQYSSTVNSVK